MIFLTLYTAHAATREAPAPASESESQGQGPALGSREQVLGALEQEIQSKRNTADLKRQLAELRQQQRRTDDATQLMRDADALEQQVARLEQEHDDTARAFRRSEEEAQLLQQRQRLARQLAEEGTPATVTSPPPSPATAPRLSPRGEAPAEARGPTRDEFDKELAHLIEHRAALLRELDRLVGLRDMDGQHLISDSEWEDLQRRFNRMQEFLAKNPPSPTSPEEAAAYLQRIHPLFADAKAAVHWAQTHVDARFKDEQRFLRRQQEERAEAAAAGARAAAPAAAEARTKDQYDAEFRTLLEQKEHLLAELGRLLALRDDLGHLISDLERIDLIKPFDAITDFIKGHPPETEFQKDKAIEYLAHIGTQLLPKAQAAVEHARRLVEEQRQARETYRDREAALRAHHGAVAAVPAAAAGAEELTQEERRLRLDTLIHQNDLLLAELNKIIGNKYPNGESLVTLNEMALIFQIMEDIDETFQKAKEAVTEDKTESFEYYLNQIREKLSHFKNEIAQTRSTLEARSAFSRVPPGPFVGSLWESKPLVPTLVAPLLEEEATDPYAAFRRAPSFTRQGKLFRAPSFTGSSAHIEQIRKELETLLAEKTLLQSTIQAELRKGTGIIHNKADKVLAQSEPLIKLLNLVGGANPYAKKEAERILGAIGDLREDDYNAGLRKEAHKKRVQDAKARIEELLQNTDDREVSLRQALVEAQEAATARAAEAAAEAEEEEEEVPAAAVAEPAAVPEVPAR